MKIAIMQPYFLPYLGYFQLISAVDKFVILDDVHFTRKGWTHRNNLIQKVNGVYEASLFSVPLKAASQNKLINQIERAEIAEFSKDFLSKLKLNYSKAPFFSMVLPLVSEILNDTEIGLSLFIVNSINKICDYVGLRKEILLSSALDKNNDLRAADRIIEICKTQNASVYINAIGGIDLYNEAQFSSFDIALFFIKMDDSVSYKQYDSSFVPFLSIIDVLMFNSKEDVLLLLQNYTLIKSTGVINE